jgi:hypothetical protein
MQLVATDESGQVATPQMYNKALWETSGHWQNYQADMYAVHEMQPEGTPAASLTTGNAWTKAVTEPQVTACSSLMCDVSS